MRQQGEGETKISRLNRKVHGAAPCERMLELPDLMLRLRCLVVILLLQIKPWRALEELLVPWW
jgi:hypothetical protein